MGFGEFSVPSLCEYTRERETPAVQHVLNAENFRKYDDDVNAKLWMQPAPVSDRFDAVAALAIAVGSDRAVFLSSEQQLAMGRAENNSGISA